VIGIVTREQMEALVSGIRQLVVDHPRTDKGTIQVRFNNFAESSLDILVMFHFDVQDYSVELREREAILLRTMDLMNELGIGFAFPTRTLQIEAMPPVAGAVNATMSPLPIT